MIHGKGNRTVRFADDIPTGPSIKETDVEENTPGIDNNYAARGENFSLISMYRSEGGNYREAASQKKLTREILEISDKIREAFAEFYTLLSETPLFISRQEKKISTVDFEQYLESLKTQLAAFEKRI